MSTLSLVYLWPVVSPYTPCKLVSLTKTYTACVLVHLLLRALYLQRNARRLTYLKRFRLTGLILLLSHTWNDPNMKHHMHEKSSPVIFDVVGGAGRWKSSENRGVVEGREVWGSTSALFYCADVALGYCSTVRCSSTFLSLLPLRHFSLTVLPPSLFLFSLKQHNFSLYHFSQTNASRCVFSLFVSSKLGLVRHARLPLLYSTEIQNH